MKISLASLSLCIVFLVGCANMQPKAETLTSDQTPAQKLTFKSDLESVKRNVKQVLMQLNWQLLYEGADVPNSDRTVRFYQLVIDTSAQASFVTSTARKVDERALWDQLNKDNRVPTYFMRAKTPTSLKSFGAVIYVAFHEAADGVFVSTAVTSNQIAEKPKLSGYLDSFNKALRELEGR